ncbi:hypothetical protein CUJ83_14875 [Methanocella sp. CWC-04]|uniref:Uncharacterized protein n=1 Tax=Methanooceanicella nereidis TaxID=2052831 RepID=A0AAP2REL1_9EURY|nr:hypothetical protein [Methanocella sp. CWC-04]MCD1296284.1 hypothetical protein [Methanocella sp. CWC-04]
MDDLGYSTMMDAIMFLSMVSVCALILSPAIFSDRREMSTSEASLRKLASSTLLSMESARADYFEHRIMGDLADEIAGIGADSYLYREMTSTLLGRGSRHKTVMEIAAENAACQFKIRAGERTLRLNPFTGDYDRAAVEMLESFISGCVDSRFSYQFTLTWSPFPGVPFEGSVTAGETAPNGAVSAGTYVTMPYATNINKESIKTLIAPELDDIENSIEAYKEHEDDDRLRNDIRRGLEKSLEKTADAAVNEVWQNTIGRINVNNSRFRLPDAFLTNNTEEMNFTAHFPEIKDALCSMVVMQNSLRLDSLSEELAMDIESGSIDGKNAGERIVSWLSSMYEPARARACLYIWVDSHVA